MSDAERIAELEQALKQARKTNERFHRRLQSIQGWLSRKGERYRQEMIWYREWVFHAHRRTPEALAQDGAYTRGLVFAYEDAASFCEARDWSRYRGEDIARQLRKRAHDAMQTPQEPTHG